jgi:opacity protein-like surface antigen
MNKLLFCVSLLAAAGLTTTSAASMEPPNLEGADLELYGLVQEIESVLPQSWRVVESSTSSVPIGWTGPGNGLYVMVEDTSTRFFHPNGFHYYSFYRIWLMPHAWEGEMRHTPYVSDSAPAFLLGLNDRYVALYHTAGGNVWEEGPGEMVSLLGLDRIRYTDLTRRVVDMEMEERLVVDADRGKDETFEMNPYRIVGLSGAGPSLYLEYVFGSYEDSDGPTLDDLTERLAGSVFERFPEVESLYLRRCTADTFTDTIVNRD